MAEAKEELTDLQNGIIHDLQEEKIKEVEEMGDVGPSTIPILRRQEALRPIDSDSRISRTMSMESHSAVDGEFDTEPLTADMKAVDYTKKWFIFKRYPKTMSMYEVNRNTFPISAEFKKSLSDSTVIKGKITMDVKIIAEDYSLYVNYLSLPGIKKETDYNTNITTETLFGNGVGVYFADKFKAKIAELRVDYDSCKDVVAELRDMLFGLFSSNSPWVSEYGLYFVDAQVVFDDSCRDIIEREHAEMQMQIMRVKNKDEFELAIAKVKEEKYERMSSL